MYNQRVKPARDGEGTMTDSITKRIQAAVARVRDGDEKARWALVELASERYKFLATLMLDDVPLLRSWVESRDVLQDALLRMQRALTKVTPNDEREFRGLVRLQIRRELLELLRTTSFQRWERFAVGDSSSAALDAQVPATASLDPAKVALWTEFHETVDRLPEPEREVFERLYYEGMKQEEAAAELGVSVATIKLRWARAKKALYEQLGAIPGEV